MLAIHSAHVVKVSNAPVLPIVAKQDGWITPLGRGKLEDTMLDILKSLPGKLVDDDDAFANPSNPNLSRP